MPDGVLCPRPLLAPAGAQGLAGTGRRDSTQTSHTPRRRRTRRGAQVDRSGAFTPVGTIKLISLISSALMVILGVTAALALDPNAGGRGGGGCLVFL